MFSSIDQLTTVASGAPMLFWENSEPVSPGLHFHLVLRFSGGVLGEDREMRLKKYIAGFVRKTGGSIQAVSFASDRVHLLIGLSQFRALGTFVRELKLVSAAFANRKLGAESFCWKEKHDAFTVSLSQIERVCCYIRRQQWLDRQESYASSWHRRKFIEPLFKRELTEVKRVCRRQALFLLPETSRLARETGNPFDGNCI